MVVASSTVSRNPSADGGLRNAGRPLTVLQVLPRLDLGGVERGTLEIARAIVDAGGRAIVASEGGRLAGRLSGLGGELFTAPLASKNPLTIWANAARLARLITERKVDVVHARSRAPAWSAWLAARRTGAAFVTTWHGVYGEKEPFKRLYNSVMSKGRPTIAVSDFIADMIRERCRIEPENLVVIPRGADIAAFAEERVGAERAIAVARAWGLVEDPRPVAMLAGRLSKWKGQGDFIEAAALLQRRRGADFLCIVVGEDGGSGYARTLGERVVALGAQNVVRLVGPCDDMPAAYKLAAVVVSASIEPEAFGRVAVEAQAMGRPVIATNHGGARETVDDGRTGWLYPPGDAEALSRAIDAALSLDASARAHMGMAGRARVASMFTVSSMQRATLEVYERAAGRTFGALLGG